MTSHRRMRDPGFGRSQEEGLRLPHVAAINALVDELRSEGGRGWMPYVAPVYGGVHAELLSLFRDPGPMTSDAAGGSGFLCLENDDPSAERLAELLDEAGIGVGRTVPWNAYPWYINRQPRAAEIDAGLDPLCRLLRLLPRLRVVMLHGGDAQSSWKKLKSKHPTVTGSFKVICTYHTGNQAFIGTNEVREARLEHLRTAFRRARSTLNAR